MASASEEEPPREVKLHIILVKPELPRALDGTVFQMTIPCTIELRRGSRQAPIVRFSDPLAVQAVAPQPNEGSSGAQEAVELPPTPPPAVQRTWAYKWDEASSQQLPSDAQQHQHTQQHHVEEPAEPPPKIQKH